MSRICEVCQKSKLSGKKVKDAWGVSYRSNKKFEVNLRNTTLMLNGKKEKVKICSKCLKSYKNSFK